MRMTKIMLLTSFCLLLVACGDNDSAPAEAETWSHLQSINFVSESYEIVIGNMQEVTATDGLGSGVITYSSSDESIATVSGAGSISAHALGSVTMTATKAADSKYAEATATTTITVIPPKTQVISFVSTAVSITLNTTKMLAATGGAGTGVITYTSSDANILTISPAGLVEALAVGTAIITATKPADSDYLEATATAEITVEAEPVPLLPPVISMASSGNARATISWNASGDEASFSLYSAKESIGDPANYASLSAGTLTLDVTSPFTMIGLDNGERYYFVVTTSDGVEESAGSNELSVVPQNPLNDTGILFSANATSGLNGDCTQSIDSDGHVPQDCDQGRDADATLAASKVGTGVASFDFSKLASDGAVLAEQTAAWSNAGSEAAGTQWSCVKDNVTGLIWEIKTATGVHSFDEKVNWSNRALLAETTNGEVLCGLDDWRVPTPMELLSIVNNGRQNPAFDTVMFPNGKSQSYWTSLPDAGNAANAWTVNFFAGIGNSKTKTMAFQVRLVSGDYQANDTSSGRYTVNEDGTVTDRVTGLMWTQCPEGLSGIDCSVGVATTSVWGASMKAARDSTYAGYDDWRIPNMKEYQSIVAFDRNNPAINTAVFPGEVINFWSSSPKAQAAVNSFQINFTKGLMEAKARTGTVAAQRFVRDAD